MLERRAYLIEQGQRTQGRARTYPRERVLQARGYARTGGSVRTLSPEPSAALSSQSHKASLQKAQLVGDVSFVRWRLSRDSDCICQNRHHLLDTHGTKHNTCESGKGRGYSQSLRIQPQPSNPPPQHTHSPPMTGEKRVSSPKTSAAPILGPDALPIASEKTQGGVGTETHGAFCRSWCSPVPGLGDEPATGLHLHVQSPLHATHLHVLVKVPVHVILGCRQLQLCQKDGMGGVTLLLEPGSPLPTTHPSLPESHLRLGRCPKQESSSAPKLYCP